MIPVRMSKNKKQIPFSSIGKSWSDQRGITGLETATGLFSSDKAKETHAAGLSEARGTLELKGSVVAKVSGTTGASGVVTSIEFQLSNAAAGEAIDMTPGNTVIKYGDKNQTLTLNPSTEFSASNIASFGDSDYLLEVGEVSRSPF